MSFMVVLQNKGQDRAVKKGVSFYENDFAGGGAGKDGLQPALRLVKQTPRNRLRKSAQPASAPIYNPPHELFHHLRPVSP